MSYASTVSGNMDAKRRARLVEAAIDQLEPLSELVQKATGRFRSPLLKESERLRRQLIRKLRSSDYPPHDLERVVNDIVQFHEACRKFLQIVEEVLKTRSDPGLMSLTLGKVLARLRESGVISWKARLARMSKSLPRFRKFLSGKAAIRRKGNRSHASRRHR